MEAVRKSEERQCSISHFGFSLILMSGQNGANGLWNWLLWGVLKESGKNSGVLQDQGQIYFYGCSADVILLHRFCNLFPCQTQAYGLSVARNVAAESSFAQACVLVSKNRCAEILAGHSSGRVSGAGKPHCVIQTGAEVSVRRGIRTLQG